MSQKTPPNGAPHLVAIIDRETLKNIEKLAAEFGVEPGDVIVELLRIQASERPDGVTLH